MYCISYTGGIFDFSIWVATPLPWFSKARCMAFAVLGVCWRRPSSTGGRLGNPKNHGIYLQRNTFDLWIGLSRWQFFWPQQTGTKLESTSRLGLNGLTASCRSPGSELLERQWLELHGNFSRRVPGRYWRYQGGRQSDAWRCRICLRC